MVKCITKERTDYGKAIRKDYENHVVDEKIGNMTKLSIRNDDLVNTITTVTKDNLICKSVMAFDEQNNKLREKTFGTLTTDGSSPKHNNRVCIKQATEKGYIECKVGGWQTFHTLHRSTEEDEFKGMEKYLLLLLHKNQIYVK